MKIVVIYGEDETRARTRYAEIIAGVKKKGWEVVSLQVSGKFSLAEKLTGESLFPAEILFAVDELKKIPIAEIRWLRDNAQKYEGSLLFYTKGNIPIALRNALPKSTKFEKFELPKIIFSFLESFYPGNSAKCLALFENLIASSAPELIIAMLSRHLRDLYWVSMGAKGMNVPSWRAGKLKAQAQKFTKEKLADTISALAALDIKSKTSDVGAQFLLELMIVEKLA